MFKEMVGNLEHIYLSIFIGSHWPRNVWILLPWQLYKRFNSVANLWKLQAYDFNPSWAPLMYKKIVGLTHWGRVTHICIGNLTIIGSDNGLSSGWGQAITWTNVGILLIGPLGTNFSEMLIEIHTFSLKKTHLKKLADWTASLSILDQIFDHEIWLYQENLYGSSQINV